MPNKEDIAGAYLEATGGSRSLARVRHEAPKRNRVKPDPEDNPLAELDYKEFATLGDEAVRLWTRRTTAKFRRARY